MHRGSDPFRKPSASTGNRTLPHSLAMHRFASTMAEQNRTGALIGGAIGGAVMLAAGRGRGRTGRGSLAAAGVGVAVGSVVGAATDALARWPGRLAKLERLMPQPPTVSTAPQVVKPTPISLFADRGTGTDFETRLSSLDGFLVPTDRFYLRSHSPTPRIDVATWRLSVHGSGVRRPIELTHEQLSSLPQVTLARTMECAGNGRNFYKKAFGIAGEGGQWQTGAIGTAEWTGPRLRDVLALAGGVTPDARDVMPVGLDDHTVSRPMPVEKALRDDTLLVLRMNGEALPPDHGYPARVLVSGWVGAASIKWLGSIEVSGDELYSAYNTTEYVMIGPHYPTQAVALGPAITEMPVTSVLDLDYPGRVSPGPTVVPGRSFAGEARVRAVAYSIDDGPWREAELFGPDVEACWRQWRFDWDATPGDHEVRVRATDDRGRTQPDGVPWNHHGYLYNAVIGHPVHVG